MTLNTVMAHAMADAQKKHEADRKVPAFLQLYRALIAKKAATTEQLIACTGLAAGTISHYLSTLFAVKLVTKTFIGNKILYKAVEKPEQEVILLARQALKDEAQRHRKPKKLEKAEKVETVETVVKVPQGKIFSAELFVENLTLKECKELFTYLGTFFK